MRMHSVKHIFLVLGYLSICLLVIIQLKSKYWSCISTFDNILDICMLDDSPCYPDIEQSLNRYFNKLKTQFSMLLTYHPKIDCEHGRYLLLNDEPSSHVYDGTGSQLMWYLGVLNIAYIFNLTLIHLPWTAKHTFDENNKQREKYWKFYDWEIPYSAYQLCSKNSSIKRNIFKYDLLNNQTLDQHYQGKQSFTIKSNLKNLFNQFINNLKNYNQIGFTFYSSRTTTITSSLMDIGIIFETRWWLQHRKIYNLKNGLWSGLSLIQSNNLPIDIHKTLLIGVHIRQGDVVKRNKQGQIISAILYRYISTSAYAPLLITLIKSLPNEIRNRYFITIYSEGIMNDFIDILIQLKKVLPEIDSHISFFLNGRTSETFNRLLRDDVLITAYSTFSIASGIFNSRQLKLGPYHNRARVHGMRNYIRLNLNGNHTMFYLPKEKQLLIKQRINYVWKHKQKQLKSSKPLWLENYSKNYPEEFMLI